MSVGLEGKTAVIFGGGSGIGKATAFIFAEAGANIIVSSRSRPNLEHTTKEIVSCWGNKTLAIPCDISIFTAVSAVINKAIERFGQLDIVVNSAGILYPVKPLWRVDPAQWKYNLSINLIGAFHITKAALKTMMAARQGKIIHVSSIAAVSPVYGWSAYCTAKAGLDHFVKVAAQELLQYGIAIYSVWPGMVNTNMAEELFQISPEDMGKENLSRFEGYREKGLFHQPQEIAQFILHLATMADFSLSGQVINFDKGAFQKDLVKPLKKLPSQA